MGKMGLRSPEVARDDITFHYGSNDWMPIFVRKELNEEQQRLFCDF